MQFEALRLLVTIFYYLSGQLLFNARFFFSVFLRPILFEQSTVYLTRRVKIIKLFILIARDFRYLVGYIFCLIKIDAEKL